MKINRMGDNFTELEKKQMLRIDELQEKIKMYEFDKSADNAVIRDLKTILKNKKNSIKEVIKKINEIQKEEDYEKLNDIKKWLEIIQRQGETNERF
jgi:CRISPR/Cas system-associated protein Csx1